MNQLVPIRGAAAPVPALIAPLGAEARDGINGILKGFGWAANPADVTGFANSESFPQIMEHMINDPGWGRSSWRVPGRTPKLSRSSASASAKF
jgi:hypothetical protein